MITLFASCSSFGGERNIIQRNAIQSWKKLNCEIILMGTEAGVAEVPKEFNIKHEPELQYSKFGAPLVNSVFGKAEEIAQHKLLCYISADIILMSDFLPGIQRVKEYFQ